MSLSDADIYMIYLGEATVFLGVLMVPVGYDLSLPAVIVFSIVFPNTVVPICRGSVVAVLVCFPMMFVVIVSVTSGSSVVVARPKEDYACYTKHKSINT